MSYQEFDFYEDVRMEGREEGREQGLEQGLEQGRVEKTYFVAYKMLKQNLTAEQIADFVGLTVEEVLKTKRQLAHEPTILQQLAVGKMSVKDIATELEVSVHLVNAIKNSNTKPGQ